MKGVTYCAARSARCVVVLVFSGRENTATLMKVNLEVMVLIKVKRRSYGRSSIRCAGVIRFLRNAPRATDTGKPPAVFGCNFFGGQGERINRSG
jgi:hypothetical protein